MYRPFLKSHLNRLGSRLFYNVLLSVLPSTQSPPKSILP